MALFPQRCYYTLLDHLTKRYRIWAGHLFRVDSCVHPFISCSKSGLSKPSRLLSHPIVQDMTSFPLWLLLARAYHSILSPPSQFPSPNILSAPLALSQPPLNPPRDSNYTEESYFPSVLTHPCHAHTHTQSSFIKSRLESAVSAQQASFPKFF